MNTTYFDKLVFDVVSQIPEGRVTTYGEIARALGDVRAARVVGESLKKNPQPVEIPCHRVVMSDGSLGGYAFGGVEKKKEILRREGINFRNGKADLSKHMIPRDWFRVEPVFKQMQRAQEKLAEKIVVEGPRNPELAAGVDVSYWGSTGVGAVVVVDRNGEVLENRTWTGQIKFPYVPTYLAFREMPFVWNVIRNVEFDVLLVDGHGWLHPRRAGEATHFGVVLNVPSIGVAKSRLVGEKNSGKVYMGGEQMGWAVGEAYVSPGNRIDLNSALKIARLYWNAGKQPIPLILAHKLALKRMRVEKNTETPFRNTLEERGNCSDFEYWQGRR